MGIIDGEGEVIRLTSLDIVYLLASEFDYDRLISADAGPGFAADYNWPTAKINDLRERPFDVAIVDTRFPPSEIDALKDLIASTKRTFVLRVCDPIWETTRNHWWYKSVFGMLDQSHVHVMLNYQPAEITALLLGRRRKAQFIFAPYVYRDEMEHPLDHAERKHAMLLSGSRNRSVYPLRWTIGRTAFWWVPLRGLCATLEHPGYPDIGQHRRHGVVGSRYLERLAAYRFAAVCSSRCRIEVLKYREFAYAGVVPVGDMPATLLDCPADAWVPWRRNFIALTRTLKAMDDTEHRAQRFRQFMRERRNATAMRAMVSDQLSRLV